MSDSKEVMEWKERRALGCRSFDCGAVCHCGTVMVDHPEYDNHAATPMLCEHCASLPRPNFQAEHLKEPLYPRVTQADFDAVAKMRQEFKESGDEVIAMLEELGVR